MTDLTDLSQLSKDQLETLTMYTEIKLAKHDNLRSYAEAKDKSIKDLLNDAVVAQRAQQAALETLALRLWGINLWHLWLNAPDDFIKECERNLEGKQ